MSDDEPTYYLLLRVFCGFNMWPRIGNPFGCCPSIVKLTLVLLTFMNLPSSTVAWLWNNRVNNNNNNNNNNVYWNRGQFTQHQQIRWEPRGPPAPPPSFANSYLYNRVQHTNQFQNSHQNIPSFGRQNQNFGFRPSSSFANIRPPSHRASAPILRQPTQPIQSVQPRGQSRFTNWLPSYRRRINPELQPPPYFPFIPQKPTKPQENIVIEINIDDLGEHGLVFPSQEFGPPRPTPQIPSPAPPRRKTEEELTMETLLALLKALKAENAPIPSNRSPPAPRSNSRQPFGRENPSRPRLVAPPTRPRIRVPTRRVIGEYERENESERANVPQSFPPRTLPGWDRESVPSVPQPRAPWEREREREEEEPPRFVPERPSERRSIFDRRRGNRPPPSETLEGEAPWSYIRYPEDARGRQQRTLEAIPTKRPRWIIERSRNRNRNNRRGGVFNVPMPSEEEEERERLNIPTKRPRMIRIRNPLSFTRAPDHIPTLPPTDGSSWSWDGVSVIENSDIDDIKPHAQIATDWRKRNRKSRA